MASGSERDDIGPAGHMSGGEGRRFLSQLAGTFGIAGAVLVAKADGGGPEGGDLPPGNGLKWPKCQCGSPLCPDCQAVARTQGELGARVAEVNERSRRSGLRASRPPCGT